MDRREFIANALSTIFARNAQNEQNDSHSTGDTPPLEPTDQPQSSTTPAAQSSSPIHHIVVSAPPTARQHMEVDADDDLPELQSVSNSSDSEESDGNQADMHVEDTQNVNDAWTDEDQEMLNSEPSSLRTGTRRPRVVDDDDDERDRRHPSQRISNAVNNQDNVSSSSNPTSNVNSTTNANTQPPQPHQPPHHPRHAVHAVVVPIPVSMIPQIRGPLNVQPPDLAHAGANNNNNLTPDTNAGNNNPAPAGPVNATAGNPFRFFRHFTNAAQANRNQIANAQPGAVPGNFPGGIAIHFDVLNGPLNAGANAPGAQQFGVPENGGNAFPDLLTRLGAFVRDSIGTERDQEDPERARKLVEGLEEVPVGLVKRMERVEGDGEGSGGGMCAVCWEPLLNDGGFGGEEDGKEEASITSGGAPLEVDSSEPSTSAESSAPKEATSPPDPLLSKVVSLPCAHVFHASCLLPWFSRPRQTTCPSCRFDIDPEGLTYVSWRRRREEREARERAARGEENHTAQNVAGVEDNREHDMLEDLLRGVRELHEARETLDRQPQPQPQPPINDNVDPPLAATTTLPPANAVNPPHAHTFPFGEFITVGLDIFVGPPPGFGTQTAGQLLQQGIPTAEGTQAQLQPAQTPATGEPQLQPQPQAANTGLQAGLAQMFANAIGGALGAQIGGQAPMFFGGDALPVAGPTPAPQNAQQRTQPQPQPAGTGISGGALPAGLFGGMPMTFAEAEIDVDMGVVMNGEIPEDENTAEDEVQEDEAAFAMFQDMMRRAAAERRGPAANTSNSQSAGTNAATQPTPAPPAPAPAPAAATATATTNPANVNAGAFRFFQTPAPFPATVNMGNGVHIAAGAGLGMGGALSALFGRRNGQQAQEGQQQAQQPQPTPAQPQPEEQPPNAQQQPQHQVQGTAPTNRDPESLELPHLRDLFGYLFGVPLPVPGMGPTMPPTNVPAGPNANATPANATPANATASNSVVPNPVPAVAHNPAPAAASDPTNTAPNAPGQQRPIGLEGLFGFSPFLTGNNHPRPPREKKAWAPPPAPGPTLRQRIERKEREAGLRCFDVSCGIGPSDEEPTVATTEQAMRQLSIYACGENGGKKNLCRHTFHSTCLVSAERVALRGADAAIVGDDVEVSCPVCRGVGCVSKRDWDEGSQALS